MANNKLKRTLLFAAYVISVISLIIPILASAKDMPLVENENLCFGDSDNIKKDFSIEVFDRVVGKNNSKTVLDWLKADFYLQSFEDLKFGGVLICRLLEQEQQEQQDKIKPHFLLIQPVAGSTDVIHFNIINNKISQINAYKAYPYEKYIYDKNGNVFLLSLEDTARHGELRFNYSIYNVSEMRGKIFTISQLREKLDNTGIFSLPYGLYQEPDILVFGGIKHIDSESCWKDGQLPYNATGIDVATIYNKVEYQDKNSDGFLDLVFSYDELNCKTKKISHHSKTFLATEDGFKEKL